MLKLNLGCGSDIRPNSDGWLNLDAQKLDGVDLVIDLEDENLPYSPNSVDFVNMQDILEHISMQRQKPLLTNIYDILKVGGEIYIQIPHLRVCAERYLNILENPTELQHPLTAEQFSKLLYGGQDYLWNFHKWGYDEGSLKSVLESIGFSVRNVHSDGGSNLLCVAFKPSDDVYISTGGGLGDIIQVYLSTPLHRDKGKAFADGRFPSSDPVTSLWFRSLWDFKRKHPDKTVTVILETHNPAAQDFFANHPYIDNIVMGEWHEPTPGDDQKWKLERDGKYCISKLYNYEFYEQEEEATIYLSSKERAVLNAIKDKGAFIAMHPFAGSVDRMPVSIDLYKSIADELQKSFNIVVLGKSYTRYSTEEGEEFVEVFPKSNGIISLVDIASTSLSTALVLASSGFVGTHSAMILPAWYAKVPSVCIVPQHHDDGTPWMDFFSSDDPTTWGADKPFNKTIIATGDKDVDIKEVADFINGYYSASI